MHCVLIHSRFSCGPLGGSRLTQQSRIFHQRGRYEEHPALNVFPSMVLFCSSLRGRTLDAVKYHLIIGAGSGLGFFFLVIAVCYLTRPGDWLLMYSCGLILRKKALSCSVVCSEPFFHHIWNGVIMFTSHGNDFIYAKHWASNWLVSLFCPDERVLVLLPDITGSIFSKTSMFPSKCLLIRVSRSPF